METRDKLNSFEGYQEIIKRQNGYIVEYLAKINALDEASKKNIQLFPLPNQDVAKNTWDSIFKYQYDNLIAKYSAGESIIELKKEINPIFTSMEKSWKKSNGYVQMVWMLSIGILLNIEDEVFTKLVKLVEKDNPNDFLVDFLIHYRVHSWKGKSDSFMFIRPYQVTQEIDSLAQNDKIKSLERLKKYLTKEWYRGHSDCGWYDAHKSKWNIHTGYWSFESGALVKILGLDDSTLKGLPYYPYDMVHWMDKKPVPKHSWTIID